MLHWRNAEVGETWQLGNTLLTVQQAVLHGRRVIRYWIIKIALTATKYLTWLTYNEKMFIYFISMEVLTQDQVVSLLWTSERNRWQWQNDYVKEWHTTCQEVEEDREMTPITPIKSTLQMTWGPLTRLHLFKNVPPGLD